MAHPLSTSVALLLFVKTLLGFSAVAFGQGLDTSTSTKQGTSYGSSTADPLQECVDAHALSRRAVENGTLIAAREALKKCVISGCPIAIRAECSEWQHQAEIEVPTLILSASTYKRDLEDVHVTVDGQLLTDRLNGEPIETIPGSHAFVFELNDGRRQEIRVVVKLGEKNRVIQALFPELSLAMSPPSVTNSTKLKDSVTPPIPNEASNHRALFFGILSAASAIVAGSFLYVGIDRRDTTSAQCAPICSDSQVNRVRRWFILADIAGATAITTGGLGLYFYFDGPTKTGSLKPKLSLMRGL
jgi:hypothetical protein